MSGEVEGMGGGVGPSSAGPGRMSGGSGPALVLASGSPRRLALLRSLGLDPRVRPVDLDETPLAGEAPAAHVARLAEAKAAAAGAAEGAVVLAADTIVVLDGDLLGKPADRADAAATLRSLSGRTHEVATGVCVLAPAGAATTVVRTAVTFRTLTDDEIAWYVATGEPLDKAGSYGIQGAAGAFVARIDGSPTNVVGLPLAETTTMLRAAGIAVAHP